MAPFPSNLIIHRPYHLTYELQDKRPGESLLTPPRCAHGLSCTRTSWQTKAPRLPRLKVAIASAPMSRTG